MSKHLYHSIKKSLVGNLSVYILQIISMIFYARMFTPEEFGVIASIHVFVVFFQLFSDMGLSPALLSLKSIENTLRDSVFTFTILLGIVIGAIFYAFTFLLNIYYNNDSYSLYGIFISLTIIFQTLTTVPTTALHRETKFYSIALINIACEILTFFVVIALFQLELGVIILIYRLFLFSILRFLLLYWASKKTDVGLPKISFRFKELRKVMHFSTFQFLFNIVNYFSRNLDNILIGKYLGISQLGIYDKSYQLMRYPLQLLTYAINPAIQPVLNGAKIDLILLEHNKLIKKLLVVSIPIALFMGINSTNIVYTLFGEQWNSVSPLISILSLIIPVQMVLSTSGSFFQSLNKPRLLFYSGAIAAVINIAFIILGVYLGTIEKIAVCLCISYTISFIVIYFCLFKYAFNASSIGFYKIIFQVSYRYLPVLIIYPVIYTYININSGISFIDLILSGLILMMLLAIFNFKMLVAELKPQK